ncbi:hypothetical protein PQR62_24080 [Herbaspirillum lusitanum]|uniref:Uncharacterized protein n=1 Tax=Herbaspirillum lusitanum TaxID=213312 RepID=A0ABW9AGK1_9BURK
MNKYLEKLAKLTITNILIVSSSWQGIAHADHVSEAIVRRANLGSRCHVEAAIPFRGTMGGSYSVRRQSNGGGFSISEFPKKISNGSLSVNMMCFNITDLHFPRDTSVRFDENTQTWKKDFSERDYVNSAENRRRLNAASRVYTIHAKNSTGYVYTENDLTGEESRRDRNMSFCLLRPPKALCGNGIVMRLSDPKSDTLPYVFQILKSMEFIEDAPETAGIADEK